MNSKLFEEPQRQSEIGILLIFVIKIFNLIKGFWALALYFLISGPSTSTLIYAGFGFLGIIALVLFYSFVYYRRFLFHIAYKNQEFRLQKGVFNKEDISVPFDKIQQVYIKRSLLQRLLNVSSFVIETAGSKKEEINIHAISNEKANQLLEILIKEKDKVSENINDSEVKTDSIANATWIYKLNFLSLLKTGISTNYLRGLVLISAFFATIYNEVRTVSEEYSESIKEYLNEVSSPLESLSIYIFIGVAVLIISVLITIAEVFIKYFNLKLTQTKESLELEMGLNTNTKVSLKPRRVQLFQVITNPVQKWLNLHEVRISLANAENDLQKSKIKIPGLDSATITKITSFLHTEQLHSFETTFLPNKILLYRRLILVLIPALISYLIFQFTNVFSLTNWLLILGFYLVIGLIWQIVAYKSLILRISEDFIYKKYGVWSKTEERFEIYKLQSISVSQPLWYKTRGLINVTFHTAGGDISFKAVTEGFVAYVNYMFYKIESSSKAWM